VKAVTFIAVLAAAVSFSAVFCTFFCAGDAEQAPPGKVYLVGIGPGDPDLATVRATRVIQSADKVYCFGYLSDVVASLAKPDSLEEVSGLLAKRFYGLNRCRLPERQRTKGEEAQKQFATFAAEVRELVARGKTVAIVDGGDPLIFGAWAWVTEEFDDLPLEVVPGVSSFNAANAALMRDVMWGGRRCVLLSGGDVLGVAPMKGRMATPTVFFTHRAPLGELIPRLLERYPADTPVAIISQAGCREAQAIVRATLATVLDRLNGAGPGHAYLVYVGDILVLQHKE